MERLGGGRDVSDPERLETLYVRAAVTAWEAMAADGVPEDERVNLAAYAAVGAGDRSAGHVGAAAQCGDAADRGGTPSG
jgi:hypothetical protein